MTTYQNATGLAKPFKARLKTALSLTLLLALFAPTRLFAEPKDGDVTPPCYLQALKCGYNTVRGDYFWAIKAVYEQDLKQALRNHRKKSRYLANIDNYDIFVKPNNGRYQIDITLAPRPGHPKDAAGYHYEVDIKTYQIVNQWLSP